MPHDPPRGAAGPRSVLTLVLCTVLHAFTHAYGAMLVPLYLLIVADLRLGGVKAASLIVTVYGLVYCMGSYAAGVVADRANRKTLLGLGLLGNAAAVLFMGLTRRYEVVLALAVLAGVAGTFFHPAANALVPAHFPKAPGMVIGLLGMGSGLGFFAGPQYAGWRAQAAGWHLGHVADWQRPCVELGGAGLLFGALFMILAREAPRPKHAVVAEPSPALPKGMPLRIAAIGSVLGFRDFAGVAGISLASIYLQKAHGLGAGRTGLIVGEMMLLSVVVNPVAVFLTPGKRRLPALVVVLLGGAAVASVIPYASLRHALLVLCAFQTCQMGSYAVSDAAMLERVSANVRGRVVGLFLVIAGTFASTGPWVMGWWTDRLGVHASDPHAYGPLFGSLGAMMAVATLSTPIIARLGRREEGQPAPAPVDPLTEVMPRTLEPAG
jgi:MFS family permease